MPQVTNYTKGLTSRQVLDSKLRNGINEIERSTEHAILLFLKNVVGEPMVIILLVTATLYFWHRDFAEGIFLGVAIVAIVAISIFQERRSKNAMAALAKLTQPKCTVRRNGQEELINTADVVVGDILLLEEGQLIPADATVVVSHDFSVNESTLTGESLPVEKYAVLNTSVYQGTSVVSGSAICCVQHVGIRTKLGLIGKSLIAIKPEKSPLQIQILDFVKKMTSIGILVFLTIWITNIYRTKLFVESLLNSLTLAMSILPEEIPVAFAAFMALAARRLTRLGIIVRDTRTVETLGSTTVICLDKTGTITKNEMTLAAIYVYDDDRCYAPSDHTEINDVITTAMWASEPVPFDQMEKTLHIVYGKISERDLRSDYTLIKEYPLSGKPPFMTHVFKDKSGDIIIAAKGAPEAILRKCDLSESEKQKITATLRQLTSQGYRVLAVGKGIPRDEFPNDQHEFNFLFKGLVAFYDPPKANIKDAFQSFFAAGIRIKLITGDNLETTVTIAKEVGLQNSDHGITGDHLMSLSDDNFSNAVRQNSIFARMYPEAKLRVVKELKKQSEIVAMTGDGVNDAPALKAANIGIAMGQKGSEVARQASALILQYDDLTKMVDGIRVGRTTYDNLKNAIQYIISIHIPIILIVFLPLIFNWHYGIVFSPLHVIFLELIMGPTCSIVYENNQGDADIMKRKPRPFAKTFFRSKELSRSIVQGLIITLALLCIYRYAVRNDLSQSLATSMIFLTLVSANVILTLVNRSSTQPFYKSYKSMNIFMLIVIGITIFLVFAVFLFNPIRTLFQFQLPSFSDALISFIAGAVSVVWFDFYKIFNSVTKANIQR